MQTEEIKQNFITNSVDPKTKDIFFTSFAVSDPSRESWIAWIVYTTMWYGASQVTDKGPLHLGLRRPVLFVICLIRQKFR